jgi:hypothetical protein
MRGRLFRLIASALLFAALVAPASAEQSSQNMRLIGSVALPGATDVEFTDDGYAVMTVNGSGDKAGLWIIDVSNPRRPRAVGTLPCKGSGYDVGLWRNIAVMSSDSASGNSSTKKEGCNVKGTDGQEGIRLVDISDRAHPKEIKFVATPCGSHTNVVVPRGRRAYVYVQSYPASTSGVCASVHGIISVVDITHPARAKIVSQPSTLPAVGCHDGAIHGRYAYMACLTEGQVWDIKNRKKPVQIAHIRDVPDAIWHSSGVSNDGKIAVFGFESFQGAPLSCSGATSSPLGALWFYDVSDPNNPVQKGFFSQPRSAGGLCTAHNFMVVPGIVKNALVTAWYSAGVMTVDFSDPDNPKEIAHYVPDTTSTWDAKWYRGHAFVGDGERGLDVYEVGKL